MQVTRFFVSHLFFFFFLIGFFFLFARMLEGFYVRFRLSLHDEKHVIGKIVRVKNSFETLRGLEGNSNTKWLVLKVDFDIFEVPLSQVSSREPTDEELKHFSEDVDVNVINSKIKVLQALNFHYTKNQSPHLWKEDLDEVDNHQSTNSYFTE